MVPYSPELGLYVHFVCREFPIIISMTTVIKVVTCMFQHIDLLDP